MRSFNLLDEKWIPCLMEKDHLRQELSIKDVFLFASQIKEVFDPSPLITASVQRFLLAILHRNFGPANESQWGEVWKNGNGEWDTNALMAYLNKWHHRFYLFDDSHPFYQCVKMPLSATDSNNRTRSYAKSVANIIHELATGNNATLFDHTVEEDPPAILPAEAARLLIAFQAFAIGGLLTYEINQNPKFYKSADNAPLVKGTVSLVTGKNLFQTLMLNLHKYNPEEEEPFETGPSDLPAWERDDETLAIDRYPEGYLDLLTWQSRRVRLIPEYNSDGKTFIRQVVIMKGNQFPDNFSLHKKEPMLAFRKILRPGKGQYPWMPLAFQEERAAWRDSLSLFQSISEERARPKTLEWLSDLVWSDQLPQDALFNLSLLGLTTNQAKISLWRHERLPLPLQYFKNELLVSKLKEALNMAENAGRLIGSGFIKTDIKDGRGKQKTIDLPSPFHILVAELLPKDRNDRANVDDIKKLANSLSPARSYWAQLGTVFNQLMIMLAEDKTEGKMNSLGWWAGEIQRAARSSFSEATNKLDRTGRSLRAVSKAENAFNSHLRNMLKSYLQNYQKEVK